MTDRFREKLDATADEINAQLDAALGDAQQDGEIHRPTRLVAAMRHGVLNGGKRLRPFLVLETAGLFDVAPATAMPTACALELLHCYSLVHDDLPAMDDDDLRRGQPTVHRAYDEATAILAGDALLTLAFDRVTDFSGHPDPAVRAELAQLLARAAGLGGMIGGQVLDLAAEESAPDDAAIRLLQAMKTGALIGYSCTAGAVLGQAGAPQRRALEDYGKTIGLAFQLADDLLDVTSDAGTMGKKVGKDADRGKGTLVGLHGVEAVRALLQQTVERAEMHLSIFGPEADTLREAARFIVTRDH